MRSPNQKHIVIDGKFVRSGGLGLVCHEIFVRIKFGPAGPNISDIFGPAHLFIPRYQLPANYTQTSEARSC